jgi:PAS domain S-box-containing protein
LKRGDKLRDYEARLLCKDGSIRTVLIDSCVRWDGDRFVHTQCFTRDITERKRTEEALRLSGRMPAENPAPVLRVSRGKILNYANPKAEEFLARWNAKVGEPAPSLVLQLIGDGRRQDTETVIGERAYAVTVAPVLDGEFVNLYFTDITERKAAENKLRRSEELNRAIIENTPECVKMVRCDGIVLAMNAAGLSVLEATPEQIIGKSIYGVIAPDYRSRFKEMHERVCNGSSERLEFEIIGLQGTRRRMESHAAPIPDPNSGKTAHLAISRDITARIRAQEQAARLVAIVEHSDAGIFSTDLEGTIRSWNRGAERLYGYSAEEVLGKPVAMLLPNDRPNEEPEIFARVRNGEPIKNYETVRRRKDGSLIHVSLTVSPLKNEVGAIFGISKVARDITDKIHAREELERIVAERTARLRETVGELEAFSYSVAHDMRAPLRAMNSYAGILEADYTAHLPSEAMDFLRRISSSAVRLDSLITDVLNYSKVARGEMTLEKVDIDHLTRDIVESYPQLHEKGATIYLQSSLPPVFGNLGALTQAVSNLLANAVKFVKPGITPEVRIRAEKKNGSIRLWFEDNGIGIPQEGLSKIFGMFQRLHPAEEFEGTGIGLTIVRKAVERMGGTVGVESQPGTGSKFWIELKAA